MYATAGTLLDQLVREHPGNTTFRSNLATNKMSLGYTQTSIGLQDEALLSNRRACDLARKLIEEEPEVPSHRLDLARALSNGSQMLRIFGQTAEAAPPIEEAIEQLRTLVEESPRVIAYREELGVSYNLLFDLQFQAGRLEEAVKTATLAGQIIKKLADKHK